MTGDSTLILTAPEAAAYLRISTKSLARLRSQGELPYVAIMTRKIVYRKCDLDRFVDARTRREPTIAPRCGRAGLASAAAVISFTKRRAGRGGAR